MRKRFRKMTAVLLAAMIVTLMIPFGVTSVSATLSLQALRNKFPSGSYFNHPVNGTNNPDVVTYTPCPSNHDYVDTCTWFGGSSQCMGFAKKVTYDYYGSMFSEWAVLYDMNSLKAGDVIKYYPAGPQHFIWVTDVSGDTITYVDCNGDFQCGIHWDNVTTKGTIYNKGFACVYSAPWAISGYTDTSAPTISNARVENVSGSSFTIKCDLYDDVGVTRVWVVLYGPHGEAQFSVSASNGAFSHTINTADYGGPGEYAYGFYAQDAAGNSTKGLVEPIYAGSRFKAADAVNLGDDFIAEISHVKSGKKISTDSNENVVLNSINGSDNQKWHFTRYSDGSYKIANCQSGKCLDVSGARTEDETNIQVYQSNEGVAQKWYIIENSNGYGLVPLSCTSSTIDVAGGSIADGANVQQYQWNQSAAQNFTIEYVSLNPVNEIEYDGHRYEFYYTYTTWSQAYRTCEKIGGHLVTISSASENEKMNDLTNGYSGGVWIGATRNGSKNWYWVNNESFDYNNWMDGQPDFYDQIEFYGEMKISGNSKGKWNDLPSNYFAQGFICEFDNIVSENSYQPSQSLIYNGKIYELYEQEVDWQNAKKICEKKGGKLVEIKNEEEQKIICLLAQNGDSTAYWIGLSDIENEGLWKWSNEKNITYKNWADGEPNNSSGIENYVALFRDTGKWNDYPGFAHGYSSMGFICEYDKITQTSLKPNTIKNYNGHKYEFYNVNSSWFEAYKACEKLGGHLVTITTSDENEQVIGLTNEYSGGAWIGATRNGSQKWYWINNESFDYNNWMDGQPDFYDQIEFYCEIKISGKSSGKWNDLPADYLAQGFICEYDDNVDINNYQPSHAIKNNGSIYELYDYNIDWQNAKKICEKKGGQLVDILSESEQNLVCSLIENGSSSAYWIGLSDLENEGSWKWNNDTGLSFSNWSNNEPNNSSGIEDYAAIFSNTGKWNDYPGFAHGYQKIGFICKRKNADFDLRATVNNNESEVTIFHNSVYGAQQYMINIYDSKTNELVFSNDGLPDREIYIKLGNGDYYVNITTDNNLISDDVYFSIKKPLIGDTNLDGSININDVTAIQRHIAELELLTEEELAVADTNGDGEISISDATHLQMYLAEYGVVLGKQS